ncbi:MAG: phage antirepressor KilAC domain-containing protein [Actinobacteria bacterium]|nr:phage antirepressor KilAC domain-containing protein [Actinomycetota bacterium]MBI3687224.1 phage antirepressor KilAC domain-containing protein [Actinomycetota bacterium]
MTKPTQLQPFTFPTTGQQVRVIGDPDRPLFHHSDACRILRHTNPSVAVRMLDDDERQLIDMRTIPAGQTALNFDVPRTGNAEAWFVTEAGLYVLALRSNAPGARAFRRWVTHDVLPAIRTGGYQTATQLTRADLARMVIAAEEERERLAAHVAELEPDAARARRTMDAEGLVLVGTVAKRWGLRERALREFLYAEHLLIRTGTRRNEPYAEAVAAGWFEVKVHLVEVDPDRAPVERGTTYVTPRGEALIWSRLYRAGYVTQPRPPAQQDTLPALT